MRLPLQKNGFSHWWIVVCCSGMMVASIGIPINCSGVFYAPVALDFGIGRGDVAMYITIMNLVTGLIGPFVIKYSAKVKLRTMIAIGGVLTSVSLASWSMASAIWQLYIAAFFNGIGNAMFGTVVINMVVGNWFTKRMGLAMGISLSFSGIAGAVLSPIFQSLIDSVGWRTSHLVAAIITALVLLPAIFLVKAYPDEKGMLPYGATEEAKATAAAPAATVASSASILKPNTVYVAIVCTVGFITAFLTGMGQHMAGFATSIGLTATVGAYLISACMVGNMSSKLLLGVLCDKIGAAKAVLLFVFITAVGLFTISLFAEAHIVILTVAAYFIGCSYSLGGLGMSQVTRTIFGPTHFKKIYANMTTASLIGSSFASSVIGYSYDLFGTYAVASFACSALVCVVFGILLWMFKSAKASAPMKPTV